MINKRPPGLSTAWRGGQRGGEGFEFLVDRHPDGLKRPGRRMGAAVAADCVLNAGGEFQCGLERLARPVV